MQGFFSILKKRFFNIILLQPRRADGEVRLRLRKKNLFFLYSIFFLSGQLEKWGYARLCVCVCTHTHTCTYTHTHTHTHRFLVGHARCVLVPVTVTKVRGPVRAKTGYNFVWFKFRLYALSNTKFVGQFAQWPKFVGQFAWSLGHFFGNTRNGTTCGGIQGHWRREEEDLRFMLTLPGPPNYSLVMAMVRGPVRADLCSHYQAPWVPL
jgi:hypothetical protein